MNILGPHLQGHLPQSKARGRRIQSKKKKEGGKNVIITTETTTKKID